MKTKVIGFESANSFVKVYHEGKELVYPNTVTNAVKENFKVSDKFSEKTVYEILGRRVNVGAVNNYQSSSMDSIERYSTKEYHIESVIAISQFVKSGDKVVAVTGIPSIHYQDKEEATELIKKNLVGPRSILKDGKTIKFEIVDVLVTLQPLATFFYCVLDEFGNVDGDMEDRFYDTQTLIIDIGWGTTDMAHLISDGLEKTFNVPVSMVDVYDTIAVLLIEQALVDKRKLKNADIELLNLEKQIREKGCFNYSNEVYKVDTIADEVFDRYAEEILLRAKAKADFDKFTTVIFTGGGAKTLETYLKKRLIDPTTGSIYDNIFFMLEGQIANAKGYFIFGKYIQNEVTI